MGNAKPLANVLDDCTLQKNTREEPRKHRRGGWAGKAGVRLQAYPCGRVETRDSPLGESLIGGRGVGGMKGSYSAAVGAPEMCLEPKRLNIGPSLQRHERQCRQDSKIRSGKMLRARIGLKARNA